MNNLSPSAETLKRAVVNIKKINLLTNLNPMETEFDNLLERVHELNKNKFSRKCFTSHALAATSACEQVTMNKLNRAHRRIAVIDCKDMTANDLML